MFEIILVMLVVDTFMLVYWAISSNLADAIYLAPLYGLLFVGYVMLYVIFRKTRSAKREKLSDAVVRLRSENEKLRARLDVKNDE